MCYVVGLASSGKVWCFFTFTRLSEPLNSYFSAVLFAVFFAPFTKYGILDYIAHFSFILIFTVEPLLTNR